MHLLAPSTPGIGHRAAPRRTAPPVPFKRMVCFAAALNRSNRGLSLKPFGQLLPNAKSFILEREIFSNNTKQL